MVHFDLSLLEGRSARARVRCGKDDNIIPANRSLRAREGQDNPRQIIA
jgi:hypothetical protein